MNRALYWGLLILVILASGFTVSVGYSNYMWSTQVETSLVTKEQSIPEPIRTPLSWLKSLGSIGISVSGSVAAIIAFMLLTSKTK
jgi:hypothetical protein